MADQGDQNPDSQFTAQADAAARAMRAQLQQQGRQIADSAPVQVGSDGRPPAPLPPEGSYARGILEQQEIQARLQQQNPHADQARQQQNMPRDERPFRVEEVEQPQAQQPPSAPASQEPAETDSSGNANSRIQSLVEKLRRKDQELQQILAQSKQRDDSVQELQSKLDALQRQHEQLLQQNLDHLDPETRMQVMLDARIQEQLANMERRLVGQIQPHLQRFEQNSVLSEMERLARKYAGFDAETHGPLIDMFRGKNPHCTVEQAFLAVSEPEERALAGASASVAPPIVPPGNGRGQPRFQHEPEPEKDPNRELAEEAARLRDLAREGKVTDRDWHEHMKRRLL